DHIHCQARDAQLLVAGRIKLRKLRDRGHLAQEPQSVETPLIDGARRPRQLRRPSDLAFDFLDELPDLGCRRFRLLALDANEGGLVLLIGKPDLGQSVGEQRNADDGQEQADIFAKQAPARPRFLRRRNRRIARRCFHSITSSARVNRAPSRKGFLEGCTRLPLICSGSNVNPATSPPRRGAGTGSMLVGAGERMPIRQGSLIGRLCPAARSAMPTVPEYSRCLSWFPRLVPSFDRR